ncbi:MAG: tetratricopeptide repeat-containing glycosyltransferase family protein [Pseudomonadota bacterium]
MNVVDKTADLTALRRAAHRAHRENDPDALQAYARYLALAPNDAPIWSNLGALHRSQKRYDAALRAQERAQAIAPDDPALRNNYANILSDLGRYDESIAARRWILSKTPDDASQKAMIGRCLRGKGAYDEAITYLSTVIPDHPDDTELKMQLAFAQLGAKAFATAFDTYRVRWDTGELKARDLPYSEWAGEPLDGKTVLVMPEQGFGDAILFSRFVPVLKDMGARVLFLTEKPVAPVFDGLEGADWVGTSLPKASPVDYWINSMELARIHFERTNYIPEPVKIHVPEESRARAASLVAPFPSVFKVGVVWTGSVTYKGNAFRSLSHRDLLPLSEIPGIQLFSLYKGPELKGYFADGTDAFIVNAAETEKHFGDSAATMQQMDLIVSSDTATLHLAGSLGVPTWALLHWDPFWVWRHDGENTDWYPGMRLFRQHEPLNWGSVIDQVGVALEDHIKAKT